MNIIKYKYAQLKSLLLTLKDFQNPILLILSRMGLIEMPYFPYRFSCNQKKILMMGRPTRTSMADLYTIKEVFKYNEYSDLMNLLPKNPIRVVDIGSNIGSFTIWLDSLHGVKEAYLFEPERDTYKLLRFNLAQNFRGVSTVINAAMGGAARTVRICLKTESPGGTSIYGKGFSKIDEEGSYEVPCRGFDEWLGTVSGEFDILKLDCEGSEWEIVKSSDPNVFTRFKIVIAEVHDDPSGIQQIPDFLKFMESLGYKTHRWDNKPMGIYLGVRK